MVIARWCRVWSGARSTPRGPRHWSVCCKKRRLAYTPGLTGRALRQRIAASEAVTDPERIKLYRIPGGSEVKDEDTVSAFGGDVQYVIMAPPPITVTIYKATDEVTDVWEDAAEGAPLWQIQVHDAARRWPTLGLHAYFARFIERQQLTLQSLERLGIRIVATDRDPDNVGFVQWRVAFYVAGPESALQNFLFLLDDFFVYLAEKMLPFDVHLQPHINVKVACEDPSYKRTLLHEPAARLPLGFFEARPVFGNRVTTLRLQPETADKMTVVIEGNTYAFRRRLDAHNVGAGFYEEEGARRYVRVLRSLDVSVGEERQRVLDMCGESVFMNLAMRVLVKPPPQEGSAVAAFVERLRAVPSLHFV